MIDIPLNKALVAVAADGESCEGCYNHVIEVEVDCEDLCCKSHERKDGENVIFKLVDVGGGL